jgi:hypothetical protein
VQKTALQAVARQSSGTITQTLVGHKQRYTKSAYPCKTDTSAVHMPSFFRRPTSVWAFAGQPRPRPPLPGPPGGPLPPPRPPASFPTVLPRPRPLPPPAGRFSGQKGNRVSRAGREKRSKKYGLAVRQCLPSSPTFTLEALFFHLVDDLIRHS